MKLSIFLLTLIILLLGIYHGTSYERGVDQTYLLPDGYEGCVIIYYDVEDAPPLMIENNEIVYHVPKNGIIYTSSPFHFGWASEEHSGPFTLRAFYINEQGEMIEQLPYEKLRFGANGTTIEDGQEKHYYFQIFGPKEIDLNGCPQLHD